MKNSIIELPVSTPDGRFLARYSEKGLAELDFPTYTIVATMETSRRPPSRVPSLLSVPVHRDDRIIGRKSRHGLARVVVNCSQAPHGRVRHVWFVLPCQLVVVRPYQLRLTSEH